ncbi:MAG: hypothetical protein V1817_02450 [Candidatus Micrarchaeota archaeon]
MALFIQFESPIKGALYSKRIENPSRAQALEVLEAVRAACVAKMFDYAPLDLQGLRGVAAPHAKNVSSVDSLASVLRGVKPGALEEKMQPFVLLKKPSEEEIANGAKKHDDATAFAWSFVVRSLFEKAFPPKPFPQAQGAQSAKGVSPNFLFAAELNGWVSVKKVNTAKAEAKEILACLVGVFASIDRKIPAFACNDSKTFDAAFESALAAFPERRNFSKLPAALEAAKAAEKETLACALGESERRLLREIYYSRVFGRLGFPPFCSTEDFGAIYPELKIPKPRGRMKKE